MQVLSARFDALANGSDTFGRIRFEVSDTLSDLEVTLNSVRSSWAGGASEAFESNFRSWLAAADDLRATIGRFGELLDTAHGNYQAAVGSVAALWGASGSTDGQTVAMSAGPAPGGGFRITLDDLRSTTKTFADLQHRLLAAMDHANGALAGTRGMAGQDPVLGRWRQRYYPMVWAVSRATRAVCVVLGVTAQKITETANAYIDAENASTPGSGSLERLPAPDVQLDPAGMVPPLSEGPTQELVPEELAEYWPNADPSRLQAAADAWRALQHELVEVNNSATTAFSALFDANAGNTFSLMRGYWERLCAREAPTPCTPDPGSGMKPFNLVSYVAGRLADSCRDLAMLIHNTRRAMTDAAQEAADDPIMEIFAEIAAILDAWRTGGVSEEVVEVGKAKLLGGYLDAERDTYLEHLRVIIDYLSDADRPRLDLFSDTHDESKEVAPTLTEAADVITGDLRGKWHELPDPHPTPDQIHITPDRAHHILDGDGPDKPGGGHRPGTGKPGKTEFPAGWSDDKIIATVLSVVRNPDEGPVPEGNRYVAYGYRDGIKIKVVIDSDGSIVTGFPPQQPGIPKNP